jgi:hypothetical protein
MNTLRDLLAEVAAGRTPDFILIMKIDLSHNPGSARLGSGGGDRLLAHYGR